jgi:hypothetical protein
MDELNKLHSILEPHLLEQFGSSKRGRPNGQIPTKLRLSAAIRFGLESPSLEGPKFSFRTGVRVAIDFFTTRVYLLSSPASGYKKFSPADPTY